jgi:hypothetical protein
MGSGKGAPVERFEPKTPLLVATDVADDNGWYTFRVPRSLSPARLIEYEMLEPLYVV